ncbi:MAG TPA: hypothetical protein VEA80_00900 [Vitreimonas sp.]|uniref:hypothetical protein n=1 Tax=Vitreimonas sp. TaxID=3069702 RepID=UPI002D2848B0|nr:hypothetical protein [Vitreimonas sp.]HYD86009.1 hypothetical protein [Vitreimonas sp.]
MQAQSERGCASALQIRAFLVGQGFGACDSDGDIAAFRALAQRLLPVEVAPLATLKAVQARTGHSLFLRETDDAAGFIAFFALSPRGERALVARAPLEPDWAEPFGAASRSGYVWGLGGDTRRAQFAVLRALAGMRKRFFAHVGLYARATSSGGERAMKGFGYATPIDAATGLYYAPPLKALAAAS